MINIQNKVDCCGCNACGDVCAHKAITFKTDIEGFWYPKVNMDTCVDCGLCEKVCPILNPDFSNLGNYESPDTYILQAPNLEDRLASASGAAYTLIARAVYKQGGYIAGHIWKDKANVIGYISSNPEDLEILRGTKYLQSDTVGMFKSISGLLRDGKLVLFSGCPCQVAALRRFLRKDYDNLITTDFTCMGIDSPLAFAKYIESLEHQYGAEMIYFKAKAKDVGWRHLTNKARFANGKSYFGICATDANLKATFQNILVRPSCYECKFKGFPRIADITIGDYWRTVYDYDSLDDNTGTSYAILNNEKAIRFFEMVKDLCNYRQVKITDILGANPRAQSSLSRPTYNRDDFYRRLQKEDFNKLVDMYGSINKKRSFLTPVRRFARAILTQWNFCNHSVSNTLRFIWINFMCSKISTDYLKGWLLFINNNTSLHITNDAKIIVKGMNFCGTHTVIQLSSSSILMLDNNIIEGGVCITLDDKSVVRLGYKTVLGNNVVIKSQHDITVGAFSLIHNNVEINDTDCGVVYFDTEYPIDKSIIIGTHTLVEQGAIIKGSTHIGDETIIKAYSMVKGFFEPLSTIAGNPANIIDNNKCWKYNF